MRYLTAILTLAILAAAAFGYNDIKETTASNGVTVASVILINVEGDEVRGFQPADNPQRFKVIMNRAGAARVTAVFTALEINGEKNIKILESEVELTARMNTADFSLKLPNEFPVGDYKVDIYVNDKLAKTVTYKVR